MQVQHKHQKVFRKHQQLLHEQQQQQQQHVGVT
jgi:hypothetical protein